MEDKAGHFFEIKGIEQNGKERLDLVIRSRHDLMQYAKYKKEDNVAFFKAHEDDVLIHVNKRGDKSYAKMNPEYVENLKKLREHNKQVHKIQDTNNRVWLGGSTLMDFGISKIKSLFGDKGQNKGDPAKGKSYLEIQELKNDNR